MGGLRETELEQAKGTKTEGTKAGAELKLGDTLRIHESGGYVHFHDDAAKLKVAVPTGIWWKKWDTLRTGQEAKFLYIDAENKACLTITASGLPDKPDAQISLTPIEPGANFAKLDKFTRK